MKWFLRLSLLMMGTASAGGLEHFFNAFGSNSNHTKPHAFHDQAAGHYAGGGFYMAQRNKTIQPLQVSLPHISMNSCGKINMYFGALSFVKSGELQELGKGIMQGAPMYAVQLALKTASPQLENTVMSNLEKALEMARSLLNSCQLNQQIVGGFLPKNSAATEQLCKDMAASGNMDSFMARLKCGKDEVRDEQIQKAKEKHPDLLVGEYNLVWKVIQKLPEYRDNQELAELIMNLVGTIISRKEGSQYRLYRVHGKADSLKFLMTYLKGGDTTYLSCDEKQTCLKPTSSEKHMSEGFVDRTYRMINEIQVAYMNNQAFTPTQISFLNDASNLPIYKYIQISTASRVPFLTRDAVEYMAISMLLYQCDKIISELLDALGLLSKVQIDESAVKEFGKSLIEARHHIQSLFNSTHTNAKWKFDQAMKAEERTVKTRNI